MGAHEAVGLAGENMLKQLDGLAALSPSLSRFIKNDGMGDVLANATVGYREWNLMVLIALIVAGDAADQQEVYLKAALEHGSTEQEIADLLNLACVYAGAPRAVNAARRMESYLTAVRGERFPGTVENLVGLSDHRTMTWDSLGTGLHDKGVPMILIHALDMDHRFWREIFPKLAAKGRTIAYDLRGHGHARGAPLTKSLDHVADDLIDLMDALSIPLADVYGSSYGGAVVQQAMVRHTDRIRSMALIATAQKVPAEELAARATDAEQHGMEAQVAKSVVRWFLPESIARDLWMVRYSRNCVRRARVEDWAAAWRAMSQLDVTEQAKNVTMPVLVLSGSKDLSATPEYMQATAKAYPTSEFVSVDQGTHMMPMENPEPVAAALCAFRDKVESKFRLPDKKGA